MHREDYENLFRMEDGFWWFRGMRRIQARVTEPEAAPGKRLLDAGCGTGANVVHFQALGFDSFGIDLSADAVPWLRRRPSVSAARASVTALPFSPASFDVVTSFDVLCQIPLDAVEGALSEAFRVLRPGGYLLVRVPAFQWLWSPADEAVLSVHRFTRPEIRALVESAGFGVVLASYANTLLFPIALAWRLLKRAGFQPGTDVRALPSGLGWTHRILEGALGLEASWLGRGRKFPFGLSVIVWARKPS